MSFPQLAFRGTPAVPAALALMMLSPSAAPGQRGGRGAGNGPQTVEATADRVFAEFNSTHTPGCAVGVERAGQAVLLRGYGMADLEANVPITGATIFESGSVAKQFTATAIMLLANDGKLNLDDPVRKYIPELPEYGRPLLIRHLLSHTSGLREWSNLVALAGWPRGTRVHAQGDLLEVITAQKSLNYPVGDYYSYTNSGFALLVTIVERTSGMSFAQFTNERIFRPLGLASTHWRTDFTEVVPGRAQAYARRGAGFVLDMPFENVTGPGGLLTTAGDWLKWNDHLDRKTLGAGVVDSLTVRAVLTSGRTISYARGLIVGTYRATSEIQHSGSTGGYSTFLARYPDRQLSVAVLCNVAGAPATQLTHALVDALAPDLTQPVVPDTVAADPAAAARLSGIYRSVRTHEPLVIGNVNGSGGGGRGGGLRALRDGAWLLGNSRALFDTGPDGAPRGIRVIGADADTAGFEFVTAKPWTPTPEQLSTFAGRYHSDEVGATWTIRVEGTRLVASPRAAVRTELTPVYPDAFTAGAGLGVLWFTRDGKGGITEMHSGSARLWDLVLRREK